jgi:GNAT superfamily N-acetyltransferase
MKLDARIDVAAGRGFCALQAVPLTPDTSNYVPVGGNPFALRLATPGDLNEVRWLVHQAAKWLTRSKSTDQWAKPWPTREARDQRLLAGIRRRRTWIVWDDDVPAATVTIAARPEPAIWSQPGRECDVSDPAVYAHRLITARNYAGQGLGAELIDWAGLRGQRQYSAKWIRIDVWTSNAALHAYYQERGFKRCGSCTDPDYPSGALFQKPVAAITRPCFPQFTEYPATTYDAVADFDLAAC